uniref:Uncharacterized protein n=1 Tax=Rhizophora mucronata TaxID=61149 RepID=A0A2P2JQV4_RHIMU
MAQIKTHKEKKTKKSKAKASCTSRQSHHGTNQNV